MSLLPGLFQYAKGVLSEDFLDVAIRKTSAHQALRKKRHGRNVVQSHYESLAPVHVLYSALSSLGERFLERLPIIGKVISSNRHAINAAHFDQVFHTIHEVVYGRRPVPAVQIFDVGAEMKADYSA